MEYAKIMDQLQALGTEQNRRIYQNHGARPPLFGVSTANLKPIARAIKLDHALAWQLYQSGNYDAMYLAGMIADPKSMDEPEFERWMDGAYFYMLADYTVAILLAQSQLGPALARKWMDSGEELRMSAGYSAYAWMLGNQKDEAFDIHSIRKLLERVKADIHRMPERAKYAMNSFLIAVGVSYLPLHDEAVAIAAEVGPVKVKMENTSCKVPIATDYIQKAESQGRIGFKRKNVRC